MVTPRFEAKKIWDLESIVAADGALPEGPPPGGEIHPDLIRYKGHWYCGLKERPHPPEGAKSEFRPVHPGGSRIIRSADGETWESVKFIRWERCGVTDLKFSVTGEGALMVSTMVKYYSQDRFAPLAARQPGEPEAGPLFRTAVSWLTTDGVDWGTVHGCPTGINTTRYSVTWHEGIGYSVGSGQKDIGGTLYRTHDGKAWQAITHDVFGGWQAPKLSEADMAPDDQRLKRVVFEGKQRQVGNDPNDVTQARLLGGFVSRAPTETVLAFQPDGAAVAVSRAHPVFAILGVAEPPRYDKWTWRETRVDWNRDGNLRPAGEMLGVQMGGPVLRRLSDGRLIAASRADASTETEGIGRLTLFEVDVENAVLKRQASFDGYSHYPGVLEHDGKLWISCGKQQRADLFGVYLLKVGLPG